MSGSVGDKIGSTWPTDLGDNNAWGGILLANIALLFDEVMYAQRDWRNYSILGGGAISWDSGTNQVSFTEDIIIRDHITSDTHTIPSTESPITLSAQNTVAYIKKVMKAGSNQTYNAAGAGAPATAAAGSLPNTTSDADFGMFVLFMRTSDDTLLIPATKREILSGDHWQFGQAQSLYERIASSHKPQFYNDGSDTSQITIPASSSAPAVVLIDGKLYANTSDKTLDLDTSGRDGLDTGTKASDTPYYLYAIPPASGRTFDVVCSVTAPSGGGPTGFSSWSYIGAFCTDQGSTAINIFTSENGRTIFQGGPDATGSHTGTTTPTAFVLATMPVTAKKAYLELRGDMNASNHDILAGGTSGISSSVFSMRVRMLSNGAQFAYGDVPIYTAQTVYLALSNSTGSGSANLFGWTEDPMEYP